MLDTALAGLVNGSSYALLALGLSLIFGVANVINFAHASVFAVGAMSGWWFSVDLGWPLWTVLLGVMAVTGLLGLVINLVAVTPLAKAPPIAALLSTFAVSVVVDNGAQLVFGPETRRFPALLATDNLGLGGLRFGTLDVTILAVAIGLMLVLGWFLRATRYGRAIRAVAQDRDAAAQMGIPLARVQNLAFVVASVLGGVAGVLGGMYLNNISPTVGSTVGMSAFAAATLGGLGSLPGAVAGGLLLGVVEAFGVSWWGGNARTLITFAVLLLVLWVRPSGLFGKRSPLAAEPMTGTFFGAARTVRLRPWQVAVAAVAAYVVPAVALDDYTVQIGVQVVVYAILALSLTLVSGQAGQISLGQAAPLAIGAYTSALLTTGTGLDFWLSLPISGLVAAVLSVALVSPSWRLRGHYVSIATLATGLLVAAAAVNFDWLTNGPSGVSAIPPPTLFGAPVSAPLAVYFLDLTILLVVLLLVVRLRRSTLGRIWSAIREDEVAARSSGIAAAEYKSLAFGIGGFVAGIGGALFAQQYGYIDPSVFGISVSLLALTIVVLGGLNSPLGAVVGAIVLVGLPEALRMLEETRMLTYGLLLLAVVLFRPQGLMGKVAR
ncbi:ABC transporter permease [Actinokineospora globicatena]|uniref:ABC transporter permease n=1 Tax=Actinokineospora globicatena TaxID=103729 RepID=UPI0020A54DD6|nr:ABC transporter permease [Actinokineospora globicatena]MCP2303017.1 branched-chain amino acid transport system permease protein [Actinokineospora globicatena]GLW79875.1 ABC transporter permease [Actinokineospora globicatena]GLW85716.1 ABC transporter permease [Actinokineospora globicatena]